MIIPRKIAPLQGSDFRHLDLTTLPETLSYTKKKKITFEIVPKIEFSITKKTPTRPQFLNRSRMFNGSCLREFFVLRKKKLKIITIFDSVINIPQEIRSQKRLHLHFDQRRIQSLTLGEGGKITLNTTLITRPPTSNFEPWCLLFFKCFKKV